MFKLPLFALTFLSVSCATAAAYAAAAGGGAMPWDTPLQTISTDLSGPTAAAVSLIGIVGIFAVLIFGGEMNHFVRALCFIVCAGSTLVGAATLFTSLGVAGATIDGNTGNQLIRSAVAILTTAVTSLALLLRTARTRQQRKKLDTDGLAPSCA
jgi:type IV secretory pathway VirB2 component (pilin)